jgi:hypothetical protein
MNGKIFRGRIEPGLWCAPLKLAFDGAVSEKDSPRVASVGQHLASTIVKPMSTGLTEIVPQRTQ